MVKIRVHDDEQVTRCVDALRIQPREVAVVVAVEKSDFIARSDGVVRSDAGNDLRGDDHDDAERDDGSEREHGAQHPFPMLVDLQALDVVPRQGDARGTDDDQHADAGLRFQAAAERTAADHQCAGIADQDEEDDGVAVEAVEEEKFMPDERDKLEYHEEARGENSPQVEGDADSIVALTVPVPFTRCASLGEATGRGAADVQVGQTGKRKAEHCAGKDDNWPFG